MDFWSAVILFVAGVVSGTIYGIALNIKVTGHLINKKGKVPAWLQRLGYGLPAEVPPASEGE